MADDRITLAGINWRETFTFTHLFRAFRVAIHPSKLVLGLLLLLSLYLGGRLLDLVWTVDSRAVPGEVEAYAGRGGDRAGTFESHRQSMRDRVERDYARLLRKYEVVDSQEIANTAAAEGRRLGDLQGAIESGLANERTRIEERYAEATTKAEAIENSGDRDTALRSARQERDVMLADAHASRYAELRAARQIKNEGVFDQFFQYQIAQVNGVVAGVLGWNWLGGGGVVTHIWNFLAVGPGWLISLHPLFFLAMLVLFLVIWAIFGGALARIAAVHVAREEKLSIRQALAFSTSKLLSFVFAPVIPLLIVAGLGVAVWLVSLLGNIPFIGEIVIGLFFILALIAGFIMTLVMLGLIGGFNLMYPTIAVEGSDSFDAISRSFSYVYARPWKMAFYTLIAVIYGALTFLFMRFFIWLTLVLTHTFVGWGFYRTAQDGSDLFTTMWPRPEMWSLPYDVNFLALGTGGDIAASLILFWVYLTISLLGAYAISFYFSANTIIYYLMRRDVDATELDDVYVEQLDEEFTETPPASDIPASPSSAPTSQPTGLSPAAPVVESVDGEVVQPPSTPPPASTEDAPGESPATDPIPTPEPPPPADEGQSNPDDENRPQ